MSRLLSPLLLAALCWVSGYHCQSNICNWAEAPSVQCMVNGMNQVRDQLADRIDLGFPIMSGWWEYVQYKMANIHIIGVKNMIVTEMAWRKENTSNFPPSVSRVTHTDLKLSWPNMKLVMNLTLTRCPNYVQCGNTVRTRSLISFNVANVALSWRSVLSDAGAGSSTLRMSGLPIITVELGVIGNSFGSNAIFNSSDGGNISLAVQIPTKNLISRFWDLNQEGIKHQLRHKIYIWFVQHLRLVFIRAVAR